VKINIFLNPIFGMIFAEFPIILIKTLTKFRKIEIISLYGKYN